MLQVFQISTPENSVFIDYLEFNTTCIIEFVIFRFFASFLRFIVF